MDDFKWVSINEAMGILHETQVAVLDLLKEKIRQHRLELWCSKCNKITPHRSKLSAVMSGNRVCNICHKMNPVCLLKKEGDSNFIKTSNKIKWIKWDENGKFNELHDNPSLGVSLIMSPFTENFTWQTTPITEIVNNKNNYIKFKTKNTIYELYYSKL